MDNAFGGKLNTQTYKKLRCRLHKQFINRLDAQLHVLLIRQLTNRLFDQNTEFFTHLQKDLEKRKALK